MADTKHKTFFARELSGFAKEVTVIGIIAGLVVGAIFIGRLVQDNYKSWFSPRSQDIATAERTNLPILQPPQSAIDINTQRLGKDDGPRKITPLSSLRATAPPNPSPNSLLVSSSEAGDHTERSESDTRSRTTVIPRTSNYGFLPNTTAERPDSPPASQLGVPAPLARTLRPESSDTPTSQIRDMVTAQKRFAEGRSLYYQRRYQEAATRLQLAINDDSTDPLYYYFLALAQFQMGNREQATAAARTAAALEQRSPIQSWGRVMERCQGAARVWLEQQRAMSRR